MKNVIIVSSIRIGKPVMSACIRSKDAASRCLVFVNAKDTAKWLDEQLYEKAHFETGALHGNLAFRVQTLAPKYEEQKCNSIA